MLTNELLNNLVFLFFKSFSKGYILEKKIRIDKTLDLRYPEIGKLIFKLLSFKYSIFFSDNSFFWVFHSPNTSKIYALNEILSYLINEYAEFTTFLIVATFDKYGDQ